MNPAERRTEPAQGRSNGTPDQPENKQSEDFVGTGETEAGGSPQRAEGQGRSGASRPLRGGMRWKRLRRLGAWWGTALTAALGVVVAAAGAIRVGGYLIALALAAAALARAVLPAAPAGGIVVRRRWLDVASLTVLALIVFVAFTLVRL